MKDLESSLQFDVSDLVNKARCHVRKRVDGISINLPFISISIKPDDVERRVAREIVIRLADKRVLNAFECCDSCVERALESLQNIRSLLVEKQVELSEYTDGGLYIILEMMLSGVRQFFTFEEKLRVANSECSPPNHDCLHRDKLQSYFSALEILRSHLYRCLNQVAIIANVEIPKISAHMRYDNSWQLEAYKQPKRIGRILADKNNE